MLAVRLSVLMLCANSFSFLVKSGCDDWRLSHIFDKGFVIKKLLKMRSVNKILSSKATGKPSKKNERPSKSLNIL